RGEDEQEERGEPDAGERNGPEQRARTRHDTPPGWVLPVAALRGRLKSLQRKHQVGLRRLLSSPREPTHPEPAKAGFVSSLQRLQSPGAAKTQWLQRVPPRLASRTRRSGFSSRYVGTTSTARKKKRASTFPTPST